MRNPKNELLLFNNEESVASVKNIKKYYKINEKQLSLSNCNNKNLT